MKKIVVVDYGMGNLRSVAQALRAVAPEFDVKISGQIADLKAADRVVLPGQGAMHDCMCCLEDSGLKAVLMEVARTKPFFGVCVGEQMFFDSSEEGDSQCLGLLPGRVKKFNLEGRTQSDGTKYKVPQMGWNQVNICRDHPLWNGISNNSYFYFVHSYYVCPANKEHCVATTEYGDIFCSAVAHENIFATQFHPEKSASAGLQLYRNFVSWQP